MGSVSVGDLFAWRGRRRDGGGKSNASSVVATWLARFASTLHGCAVELAAGADFDPGMTPLFNIPAPGISSVYTEGRPSPQADATMVRVVIECAPIGRADAMLEAQVRPTTTGENYRTSEVVARPEPNIIVLGGMRNGETWDLRVRWIVGAFQPGPWAHRSGVTVEGYDTAAALTLDNRTLSAFGGQALLRWDTHRLERPFRRPRARPSLHAPGGGDVGGQHVDWARRPGTQSDRPCRSREGPIGARFRRIRAPGAGDSVSTKQASAHAFGVVLALHEHPDWAGIHTGTEVAGLNLQMGRDVPARRRRCLATWATWRSTDTTISPRSLTSNRSSACA